jgi:excisionase family DNA binding protein
METTEKILTLQEVADYVRVPLRKIREAVRNRELEFIEFTPGYALGRKTRRITQSQLNKWLNSLSQPKEPTIL